jgi:hypothetical protein
LADSKPEFVKNASSKSVPEDSINPLTINNMQSPIVINNLGVDLKM